MADEQREPTQARVELTPTQTQRLWRALRNVDPNQGVSIEAHPKGIVVSTNNTRQRWRVGPRGGNF